MIRLMIGAAAVGAIALIAGFGYGRIQTSTAQQPTTVLETKNPLPSPEEYLVLRGPLSTFQGAILADGEVTLAEYESMIDAMLECGAVDGWVADPIPGEGLRPKDMGFKLVGPLDPTAAGRHNAALTDCRAEFFDGVSVVWTLQQQAAGPELVARAYEALNACLGGEHGPPLDQERVLELMPGYLETGDQALLDLRVAVEECSPRVEAETGYSLP